MQPAAAAAAGVLHWLPAEVNIGDMFHPGCMGAAPPLPEHLPEEAVKEYQHFSALLAVSGKHFVGCDSVAVLLRTLEAGTEVHDASAKAHGWSLVGPENIRSPGGRSPQQGCSQMSARGGIEELERETCRAVLADLRRCELWNASMLQHRCWVRSISVVIGLLLPCWLECYRELSSFHL